MPTSPTLVNRVSPGGNRLPRGGYPLHFENRWPAGTLGNLVHYPRHLVKWCSSHLPQDATKGDTMSHDIHSDLVTHRETVAWDTMHLIGSDVLGAMNTRGFRADGDIAPVLTFQALLLPFRRSDGKRAKGRRWLTVQVTAIEGLGRFDVFAFGYMGGRYRGHCKIENVPASVLPRCILALDYDGPEVLDPTV